MKFSHINASEIHPAYWAVSLSGPARLPYKQALRSDERMHGLEFQYLFEIDSAFILAIFRRCKKHALQLEVTCSSRDICLSKITPIFLAEADG
jgi:hypothetical protein